MRSASALAAKARQYIGVPDRVLAQAKNDAKRLLGGNPGDHTVDEVDKAMMKSLEKLGFHLTVGGKYVREDASREHSKMSLASLKEALNEMKKCTTERESWVPKDIKDESVAHFMGAADRAKEAGKDTFEFGGKKYKVTMKDKTSDAIKTESVDGKGSEKRVTYTKLAYNNFNNSMFWDYLVDTFGQTLYTKNRMDSNERSNWVRMARKYLKKTGKPVTDTEVAKLGKKVGGSYKATYESVEEMNEATEHLSAKTVKAISNYVKSIEGKRISDDQRVKDIQNIIKGLQPTHRFVKEMNEAMDTTANWKQIKNTSNEKVYSANVAGNKIEIEYYSGDGFKVVQVDFARNGSTDKTGEGNASRIFGAVMNHTADWVKSNPGVREVHFDAEKPMVDGKRDISRAKLYSVLVKTLAKKTGFSYSESDKEHKRSFVLKRKANMQESTNKSSTAQYGVDPETTDSFDKQTPRDHNGWNKEGMREDEFLNTHKVDVIDTTLNHKDNVDNAIRAMGITPPRKGDQLGSQENSFTNIVSNEVVDGIKAALDKIKTNQ